ncbi:MAG: BlaR1 family beta-lactam sensor/signal transducer [Lachnospiraceae bacterium]|nr:BlaR1 family beta-lactam sensor/signal transducer [Lachnospiraceae bacterium]
MLEFVIRFFICNIYIAAFIGLLLGAKHLFRRCLSARTQFHMWFLMLGLMVIPFLPFHLSGPWKMLSLAGHMTNVRESAWAVDASASLSQANAAGWANNFAVSVSRDTPSTLSFVFCFIWIAGIVVMLFLVLYSLGRLRRLKGSALPLQNKQMLALFRECCATLRITKDISIYSTAFLSSPITTGFCHPQIYIPIHLISDYNEKDMRYILLHELQHYHYKDAIPNFLMNLAGMLYWFNPAVWYALREMRTDREVACDAAVLQSLSDRDYVDYGTTLINFAEKMSLLPFPFASGLGGNMQQIKRRILHIVSYHPLSAGQKAKGLCVYVVIALFTCSLAPVLSTYAAEQERDHFQSSAENVSSLDLSSYFQDYNGSFVLYEDAGDTWNIYNEDSASTRVAPDSTYKIYEGLMGLETGMISQADSRLGWDGTNQPFASWNGDQDLASAMRNSVNWYFERIGASIGASTVQNYLDQFDYGNKDMSAGSSYWMEASLKISPIEQVELLKKFNKNEFHMNQANIETIKDAICLSSDSAKSMYGKTGTGRVNGQDVNGWFIGYVEKAGTVYYFATNIQGESEATGTRAAEITKAILSDLQI